MSGAIQLTEVDFQQIKDNLVNYLKSTKQFTDYDFDGSNLQVILNLLAYQAQLNAYSTNMIANESFLTSASVRNNVVANARSLGYTPTSARSALSVIDFQVQLNTTDYPGGFPKYLELSPGISFSAGSGQGSFIFNTVDVHVAPVDSSGLAVFSNISIYEGIYLPAKFVVDKSDYTQRFILENPKVDTSTIRVEVQEDPNLDLTKFYVAAENLTYIDEKSKVYWLEEDDESYYELTFGDGHFGFQLPNSSIINVNYVISNGELGNGIQGVENFIFEGTILTSEGTPISPPVTITSVTASNGGSEIESVSSIKFRAPKHYGAQSRCVTAQDYEAIVRRIYPAVEGIYVFGGEELDIPQYGRVYIIIKPLLGETLSNITKNFIKKSLDNYRVGSLDIVIQDPTVLYGEVYTTAYYDEMRTIWDTTAVVSAIKETLENYASSLNVSKFGGALKYSRIVSSIDDTDESITRNNTYLRMRKDMKAVVNGRATYEVCFENEIKIDATESVVYSTWFNLEKDGVPDLQTQYRLEDDPDVSRSFDYTMTMYTDLSETQREEVKGLLPLGYQGQVIPNYVWIHKDNKEIRLSLPKGKIRLFHFNDLNEKVIDDPELGTVDYDKGELELGYEKGKDMKIIGTEVSNGIVEIRALPRSLDIIARNTVYMKLDIAKSTIMASPEKKITEP